MDLLGDHQAADAAAGRATECSDDGGAVAADVPTQYIAVLNEAGIVVLLGTPTVRPPSWLINARSGPDWRMLYEDGTRWEAGGRSLLCVNHPYFIERSHRIAAALGERYAQHPDVFGFQINNEPGMYGTRCYCDHCLANFRAWLQAKYSTIDALNQRLGIVFGSNEFSDWDDVPIPRRRQDLHNPGLLLDSQRFFSDAHEKARMAWPFSLCNAVY